MSKLLFVIFTLVLFFISIVLLLIYKKKYNLSTNIKNFSTLIFSSEQQQYNPDVNTNNWYLHKNRLIKFKRSQYKGLTFFVSSENRIYYLSDDGTKVYC